jgi:hypothetical protein
MSDNAADDDASSTSTTDRPAVSASAFSSAYKVLGELSDPSGAGVLGQNNAASGTPIGVEGSVPNADGGYGLYTADDAGIEGVLDTNETDFEVAAGTTSTDDARNVVLGHAFNDVLDGAVGGTISGGGWDNGTTARRNTVADNYGTVGGGRENQAGSTNGDPTSARFATVGGGEGNTASDRAAFVGGGENNTAAGYRTAIGGGGLNDITGNFGNSTIAGGFDNTIDATDAFIGGGIGNTNTEAHGGVIGGGWNNSVSGGFAHIGGGRLNDAGEDYATIAGGGPSDTSDSTTREETKNAVYDAYGTIGGGGNNQAGTDDSASSGDDFATVAGGEGNAASGGHSTIGGGQNNTASDFHATVGGGQDNTADAWSATIGGGRSNVANEKESTVGGGSGNTASADFATVSGGQNNEASGWTATVSGGAANTATGQFSFAAGRGANANHDGAFVFGDSTSTEITSSRADQLLVQQRVDIGDGDLSGVRLMVEGDSADDSYFLRVRDAGSTKLAVHDNGGTSIGTVSTPDTDGLLVGGDGHFNGTLTAGDKQFVQTVETEDGEKEVVYTCTEAGTARTEASGVARLEDGRAEVPLPEHFAWVTSDEEPLLVQTTPYGGSSGLKVVERSTGGFVVEALDGQGDYEFAYTVKGTRRGKEDKPVVRDPATHAAPAASADD